MNIILKIIQAFWKPISELPAWKWIEENVELPPDSELKRFDFDLFPFGKFVVNQLCHNERLRRFTEMLSSQVGKTVTMLAVDCWKIINRPCSMGWYTDSNITAKGDFKTKILPMLESCPAVAELLPNDRARKGNTLIQFGFMNFRVMGAEARSNREGKTMAEVQCDEVRNYKPGAMQQIDNRFKTVTNYRRIIFSSAGKVDQEPNVSFQQGTRHLGFWKCPHCSHKQTFRFGRERSVLYPKKRNCGGFIWQENEKTMPETDVFDWSELEKTIRYQCENETCKYEFQEHEKIALIRSTEFEQTNLMADPSDVSVHCWEAYMPFAGCSWISIVTKYLKAAIALKHGFEEPMNIFFEETLGEPRDPNLEDEEIEILFQETDLSKKWPFIFMTVDCQANLTLFYVVIRGWMSNGENMRLWRGHVDCFEAIRQKQIEFNVKPQFVCLDPQYQATQIYRQACRYVGENGRGWTALQSTGQKSFTHKSKDGKGKEERIYAQWNAVDGPFGNPLLGFKNKDAAAWLSTVSEHALRLYRMGALKCRIFPFSRHAANDMLQNLIEGKGCHQLAAPASEANQAEEKIYKEHIAGEIKVRKPNAKTGVEEEVWIKVPGKGNHYRTCEQMQIVCAAMAGCLTPKIST